MKTALVTGASRGIGRETALMLSRKGFAAAVNYNNNREKAEELCRMIIAEGGTAAAFRADVSDAEQVRAMIDDIHSELGSISVLVNNAGIAGMAMFRDITESEWDRMFAVNVKGVYLTTQAALPDMVRAKYGRIINISSMWGITGGSCEVHYSAAKAAVIGMTKALSKELGLSGITVNCIAPGVIDTDMNACHSAETMAALCEDTPLGRTGTVTDVASAVCFLVSDGADFITGQVLPVDGGITV